MLALSLAAWCALLALLALGAALIGLPQAALALAAWAQALLLALLAVSSLTLLANLPPLRRLWPERWRRVRLSASGSLGEL
jgi:hypothetical protein